MTSGQARQRARTMLAAYRNGDSADPGIDKDALFETVAVEVLDHCKRLWKPGTLKATGISGNCFPSVPPAPAGRLRECPHPAKALVRRAHHLEATTFGAPRNCSQIKRIRKRAVVMNRSSTPQRTETWTRRAAAALAVSGRRS